jgi:hypothetical protein
LGNPYNRSTDGKLVQWQGLVDVRGAGALVLLFLLVMLVFLGFSWYTGYRSAVELFANQAHILLLAVRLVSATGEGKRRVKGEGKRRVKDLLALLMLERDSIHRAGGSPWGVGHLLVEEGGSREGRGRR